MESLISSFQKKFVPITFLVFYPWKFSIYLLCLFVHPNESLRAVDIFSMKLENVVLDFVEWIRTGAGACNTMQCGSW